MNVTDFPSNPGPDTHIVDTLIAVSKKTRMVVELKLAELGLMTGDDEILLATRDGRTFSVTNLSSMMSVRFPTMLKAVDRLVERDIIERVAGPVVRLSDRGRDLVSQIEQLRTSMAHELLEVLGIDCFGRLSVDLEKLRAGLGMTIKQTA